MNSFKKYRKIKKQTQQEIADYLGLPRSTYNRYENSIYQADYNTLLKLSNYYNVSINELLGQTEQKLILITEEEFESLKAIKRLATIIDEIEERHKNDK